MNRVLPILCTLVLSFSSLGHPTFAQESSPTAVTVSDPEVDAAQLQILLRPLSQAELEIELAAWLDLLQDKIREVGALEIQLQQQATEEGQADTSALSEQLVPLKSAEADLAQRTSLVAEALKKKGGDSQAAEQFVAAVTDLHETAGAVSYWAALVARVTNWIGREDGGELWLRRILFSLAILLVAWIASKFAGRLTASAIARHPRTSVLLENFARRTAGGIVFVVGVLTAVSALGVQIGPMMAALGAGGFIVGFALQETLGSFASGLMIMVYRPFDVNDYVQVAGVEGTVREMSLVSTTLLTVDNKVVVIPNTKVWGDTIVNYTGETKRRVDLVFGIGYDDDIDRALQILEELASQHPKVLAEPAVAVHVDALGDSAVNLFCRPWVQTADYWAVQWDLTREVKQRFDREGISFPYPQQDVHMHTLPASS